MKASHECLSLIKRFEACALVSYRCPAGVWTIGWGETGPHVTEGMVITQDEADEFLRRRVAAFEREVGSLVKVAVTQGQADALISFAYNAGSDIDADTIAEGLGDSTLLRKLNAGDYLGAANEFPKWNKARKNGELVVLNGLTKRREAERSMFLRSGH